MTPQIGSTYKIPSGIECIIVAFAKDSESTEPVVVYTSRPGLYWVLPADGFGDKVGVPDAPEPTFIVPLGPFQHFKGTRYAVVCRVRDAATLENKLVYRDDEGHTWVRPERMWGEEVAYPDGTRGPRFRPIEG